MQMETSFVTSISARKFVDTHSSMACSTCCVELRMYRDHRTLKVHRRPHDSGAERSKEMNNGGLRGSIHERKGPRLWTSQRSRSHLGHSPLMEKISGRITAPRMRSCLSVCRQKAGNRDYKLKVEEAGRCAGQRIVRSLTAASNATRYALRGRATEFRVSRTRHQVIVDHARRLHQRVADR